MTCGPFELSRSSDGVRAWSSARDPATGVSIPADSREMAEALVHSLNQAFSHHLRRELSEARNNALEEAARYHDGKAEKIARLYHENKSNRELADRLASDVIADQMHAAAIRKLKETGE